MNYHFELQEPLDGIYQIQLTITEEGEIPRVAVLSNFYIDELDNEELSINILLPDYDDWYNDELTESMRQSSRILNHSANFLDLATSGEGWEIYELYNKVIYCTVKKSIIHNIESYDPNKHEF